MCKLNIFPGLKHYFALIVYCILTLIKEYIIMKVLNERGRERIACEYSIDKCIFLFFL